VGDPEPREDAIAVTRPDKRPHRRRDWIQRTRNAAPMPGRVATEHLGPPRTSVRPPLMSRRA
jgi:hypothetical protein